MRGMRVKKLKSIFNELVSRNLIHNSSNKGKFRLFKKLYKSGELIKAFPAM